ncbi:MAG: carboxypeptidase-like regulatory domain-containing protein [Fuerstiella sp.]
MNHARYICAASARRGPESFAFVAIVSSLIFVLAFSGCGQNASRDTPDDLGDSDSKQSAPEILDDTSSANGAPRAYPILRDHVPAAATLISSTIAEHSGNAPLTISGVVYAADKQPAVKAAVGCWCKQWDHRMVLVGKAFSDDNGRYMIDATAIREIARMYEFGPDDKVRERSERERLKGRYVHKPGDMLRNHGVSVTLIAIGQDESLSWGRPQVLLSNGLIDFDLHLRDQSGVVAGRVVGEKGKPLPNQSVRLISFYDTSRTSLNQISSTTFPFDWIAKTDRDGRFIFTRLPGGMHATVVVVNSDGRQSSRTGLWTSPDMYLDRIRQGHYSANPCTLHLNPFFSARFAAA